MQSERIGRRVFGAILPRWTAFGDGGHGFEYILMGRVRRVRELRVVTGTQECGAGNMLELGRNAGVLRQRRQNSGHLGCGRILPFREIMPSTES